MNVEPVGWVESGRQEPIDDDWDSVAAKITIDDRFPSDALAGLNEFSHIEVVYVFDRVDPRTVGTSARHPRNNTAWPKVGIFAQRGKARPNRIGVSTCQLVRLDGNTLTVHGLDAIDGTPVLDIKPTARARPKRRCGKPHLARSASVRVDRDGKDRRRSCRALARRSRPAGAWVRGSAARR